ncbi:hypothetical protein A5320_14695 [Rheinheimera sp. SA_1]|nr:hypothetical protein A5320_14695 [Rheinheimera sp. SA_1]
MKKSTADLPSPPFFAWIFVATRRTTTVAVSDAIRRTAANAASSALRSIDNSNRNQRLFWFCF